MPVGGLMKYPTPSRVAERVNGGVMNIRIDTAQRGQVIAELKAANRAFGTKRYEYSKPSPTYWIGVNGLDVRLQEFRRESGLQELTKVCQNPSYLYTAWVEEVKEVDCGFETKVRFFLGKSGSSRTDNTFLVLDWAGSMASIRCAFHNLGISLMANKGDTRIEIADSAELNAFLMLTIQVPVHVAWKAGQPAEWLSDNIKAAHRLVTGVRRVCRREFLVDSFIEDTAITVAENSGLGDYFRRWAKFGTPLRPSIEER